MKFPHSLLLCVFSACASASSGQPGDSLSPDATDGLISAAQADRGKSEFEARCLECHVIGDFTGEEFEWSWRRQTAWNLYREMSINMPEDFPGDLDDQQYVDIVTYMLRINGYQIGGPELQPTEASLSPIELGAGAAKTRRTER
jgi:mono/diheme cytochrome c family protein